MSDPAVKKFMVFFSIPLATMTEWQKTEPPQREAAEKKMMQDWAAWSTAHADTILSTEVGGKTKHVVTAAVSDTRNDIVLYSLVQGASHEAVAQLYQSHPHLQIPDASIQVMEVKPMGWG
jgi:hypothetical protein